MLFFVETYAYPYVNICSPDDDDEGGEEDTSSPLSSLRADMGSDVSVGSAVSVAMDA